MELNKKIEEVFNENLTEVSDTLLNTKLIRCVGDNSDFEHNIIIFTHGAIESKITFFISEGLWRHISLIMSGAVSIREDIRILYMKEYVNIICGRAASVINNYCSNTSKLTVPYLPDEVSEKHKEFDNTLEFFYRHENGAMKVRLEYSFSE